MKKFLTVLLVIAVMFTFSFGSAFAATVSVDDQITSKVAEEQADMAEAVNDYAAQFIYNQAGKLVTIAGYNGDADGNVTKEVVEATFAQIIADYSEKIEDEGIAQQKAGKYDAAALEAAWAGADTVDVFVTYCGVGGVLYTKAIEAAKADLEATIDAIDLTLYTAADQKTIKAEIEAAEDDMDAATVDRTGLALLITAEADLTKLVKSLKTVVNQEKALAEAKEDALEAISEYAEAYRAKAADALEAIIANEKNTYTPADVAAAQTKLANLDANVAAVEAVYVARVEAAAIDEDTDLAAATKVVSSAQSAAKTAFSNDTKFYAVVDDLAGVDLLVAYAETLATNMKNQYSQTTGLATYNEATVDAKLAEVIADIEALKLKDYTAVANAMVVKTAAQEAEALETAITKAVKAITTGNYAATNWSGANKTAVKAIQEDYTAQIKAATSEDAINALVKEAKEAMDAYLTITQSKALLEKLDSTLEKYEDALTEYAQGVVAKDVTGKYTQGQVAAVVANAMDVLTDAILAEQDADMTATEAKAVIEANYAEALAVIDGIMTDDALNAEKKAVEDAIDALNTTPTLENKAEYLAVKDMWDAYKELAGAKAISATKATKLNNYLAKLERLDKEAVEALVKALPTTITVADKAAVEAALAANEAFEDEYDTTISSTYLKKLNAAKEALDNALMLDAAKKIAALPENITAADKAQVEAARAAYDALDEAAKKVFDDASSALVKKLEAAEKALQIELAYTVESLKITASSTAKKGSITVKWTVKGDTTGVEAYEIWKSTKKNSGYSKSFTTTKMSYKNTKGLKKGTRYYYKVRAIAHDAEGNKITSDWSNKAYRIAK